MPPVDAFDFALELLQMTAFSQNARLLIEQLTKLYEQTALLVQSADTIFGKDGWTPTTSSVITGSSSTVSLPQAWLARTVHRFYTYGADDLALSYILCFIAVLLFDPEHERCTSTPLLTTGWFTYPPGVKPAANYQYEHARQFLWMKDAVPDGTLFRADAKEFPAKWKLAWLNGSSLALPLEDIISADVLRERAIKPVLDGISADH